MEERKILDNILYDVDNYCSQFHRPSLNWYNKRLLPQLRQIFLISNTINEFMDLR
jgi:hypothetical protein